MSHFDNQFLTYAVTLHDWINQPGYTALFTLSFLASTLLPLGSEWLLIMMLANGYPHWTTIMTATAIRIELRSYVSNFVPVSSKAAFRLLIIGTSSLQAARTKHPAQIPSWISPRQ